MQLIHKIRIFPRLPSGAFSFAKKGGQRYTRPMIITYYGNQFFKIAQGDTVIAINPPAKDGRNGKDAARFGSVLALSTTSHPDYNGFDRVTLGAAVTTSLAAWFFFSLTTSSLEYIYMGMSLQLLELNAGYLLVSFVLAGATLNLVKFGAPAQAATA